MNCQECQHQFDEMNSGRIGADARAQVETHLQKCSLCAEAFAAERKLWEALGSIPSTSPSHGFADRILRRLDTEPEPVRTGWSAWPSWMRWSAATAVLMIAMGVAVALIFQTGLPPKHGIIAREIPVQHFEELFTFVQDIDVDSVVNG